MKYMLEIALVIGLVGLGYLWNNEKKNGLEQSDQIDKLNASVAQLQLDLGQAQAAGEKTAADLAAAQTQLEQAAKDLLDKTDALNAKAAEAEKLRTDLAAAVARVKQLQDLKENAIVIERAPAAPAARTP